jgi:hypothetical protein
MLVFRPSNVAFIPRPVVSLQYNATSIGRMSPIFGRVKQCLRLPTPALSKKNAQSPEQTSNGA